MEKTTYQQPELRNAQDQVVQSGAYGKNTALCNTQNTGAFDYINNNLQYLYDTQGTTTTDLTQAKSDITQAKADIVSLQSGKANKATTLAGYGITDAYTKSTVDAQGDRITANEGDIDTLQAQMAGTSDSALKEQIAQKVDKENTTSFTVSAGEKSLVGNTNGTLTWGGKNVTCNGSMPSGDAFVVGNNYEAPKDGWFVISGIASANGGWYAFSAMGITVGGTIPYAGHTLYSVLPAKKGSVGYATWDGLSAITIYFSYAQSEV